MTKNELDRLISRKQKETGWSEAKCRKYVAAEILGDVQFFMSPTASDVHIPGSVNSKKKNNEEAADDGMRTLYSVPVFMTGVWHGEPFDISDLDEIVRNTNILIKANLHNPPGKLGHNEKQDVAKHDGDPAMGYVSNIYRVGDQLFADFIRVPKLFYEAVQKHAYDKISAEIYPNFTHPKTGEPMGKVLRAVSFLGADVPELKGLADIIAMYHTEYAGGKIAYAIFSENDFKEAKTMKWNYERIKSTYPCCHEAIKKFMDGKGLSELTTEQMAEQMNTIQAKKYEDPAANGQASGADAATVGNAGKECPPGYKWDGDKQRCVIATGETQDTKPEEQRVCPPGMVWAEKEQKCVDAAAAGSSTNADAASGADGKDNIDPKKMLTEIMKACGFSIDETKDVVDQFPTPADFFDKVGSVYANAKGKYKEAYIKFLKAVKRYDEMNPADMEPKDWMGDHVGAMKKRHEADGSPDKDTMADDKRPPKGWFDSCVSAVSGKTDTPEKLCGHIYQHQMSPESKQKAEATRQNEDPEITKLKELLREKDKTSYKEAVDKVVKEHRGVLIPALDARIDRIAKRFSEIDDTVYKFREDGAEKATTLKEEFVHLLHDFGQGQMIIFEELSKNYDNKETAKEEKPMDVTMVTEEQRKELTANYSEHADGKDITNVDLTAIAKNIQAEAEKNGKHLAFKEALVMASAKMKAKK